MSGVALKTDHLGEHGDLSFRILRNGQPYLAADIRQRARKVDQCAVRPDVLGQTFLDNLFTVVAASGRGWDKR